MTPAPTKTANAAPPSRKPRNVLTIDDRSGNSRDRVMADLALSSIVPNTATVRVFSKSIIGELDLTESVGIMREKANAVRAGNLSGLEDTLTAQAAALDAIFNEMARRAALNMGEHLGAAETYLRMGLKAQAQCRATVQTLFEMKNPQPVAFVKQANISNGPQQINNAPRELPRAEKTANPSNELLETDHEKRLDFGPAGPSGGTHSRMATLATVHRAPVNIGENRECPERVETRDAGS